jgi:uncharacterized protein YgbK (DUF1537 family)
LLAVGARQLFFKYCATFDSTDQGNIGPVADLLTEMTGADFTAFCPSFPEAGRRVFQGHLFAGDRLISESPKRHDPLTPMTDPDLVRVLQRQTRLPVGLLPLPVLQQGRAAAEAHVAALKGAGIRYAIADAATPADLERVAELTADWPLMTGNSSVAQYYPALWRQRGSAPAASVPQLPAVRGPAVVIAGSCAERTAEQLRHFAGTRPLLTLDIDAALAGADVVGSAVEWAAARMADGPVAVASTSDPDTVARIQGALGRGEAAGLVERLLAEVADRLVQRGARRLLVAGGETSGAVLDRLGIRRLAVGAYREPGVARAVAVESPGVALCLKSGKLGPVDMILPMLASMETAS